MCAYFDLIHVGIYDGYDLVLIYARGYIFSQACDDSHLPVVQAGNLGMFVPSLQLRRVSKAE